MMWRYRRVGAEFNHRFPCGNSSSSPLRGGLAASWTLDFPAIKLDPNSPAGQARYIASLKAASGTLVEVADLQIHQGAVTYRTAFDNFVRFEWVGNDSITCYFDGCTGGWIASTPDGARHYFANSLASSDQRSIWNISKTVDHLDNSMTYGYISVPDPLDANRRISHSVSTISYTQNDAAGLGAHARVDFSYAPLEFCGNADTPIGASITSVENPILRPGQPQAYYHGARRLTYITTSVADPGPFGWRPARTVAVSYDPTGLNCNQQGLATRYIESIQETGYDKNGSATTLPPVSFTYGPQQLSVAAGTLIGPTAITTGANPNRGNEKGAKSTLMDFTGDGIADRLEVLPLFDSLQTRFMCTLRVYRGIYGGTHESTPISYVLPTMRWETDNDGWPPETTGTPGPRDSCTFNGQVTFYTNKTPANDCTFQVGSLLSYDFRDMNGDRRIDLLTTAYEDAGFYSAHDDFRIGYTPSVPPLTDGIDETQLPPDIGCTGYRKPENTEADPLLGWYVSRTFLQSQFADAFNFSAVPLRNRWQPLPASGTEAAFLAHAWPTGGLPTLIDLNGDGNLDMIKAPTESYYDQNGVRHVVSTFGETTDWSVMMGDIGGLSGDLDPIPNYHWPVPMFYIAPGSPFSGENQAATLFALRDANGDGRPDLLLYSSALDVNGVLQVGLVAYLNTGHGFSDVAHVYAVNRPIEATESVVDSTCTVLFAGEILNSGTRSYKQRMIDVNSDGLPDLVQFPDYVAFNAGDMFLPWRSLDAAWASRGGRKFVATAGRTWPCYTSWHLESDFVDVTGDGLAELVSYDDAGVGAVDLDGTLTKYYNVSTVGYASEGTPLRLMKTISNGRGATTTLTYASSNDRAVVDESPTSFNRMPNPVWVVSQVTTDPGFGVPPSTTQHRYGHGIYFSATASHGARFMGFSSSTETRPSGAETTTAYWYAGDGPHPAEVNTYTAPLNDPARRLVSSTENTWIAEGLFAGAVIHVRNEQSITHTCGASQAEADCLASTSNVMRYREEFEPLIIDGVTVLYNKSDEYRSTSAGTTFVAGDKHSGFTYYSDYSFSYHIRPGSTIKEEMDGALVWKQKHFDHVYYNWLLLPYQSQVKKQGNVAQWTERTFDMVGNVLTAKKPEQYANGGPASTNIYDEHKLFPVQKINELGHLTTTKYDLGTGAVLESRIWRDCGVPCPGRGTKFTLDGVGRVVERYTTVGAAHDFEVVEQTTYIDGVLPNTVLSEKKKDFGGTVWIRSTTTYDGLGRVTETRAPTGGLLPDAVGEFDYDASGNMIAMRAPDPRVDTGALVTYAFSHDTLGRVIGQTLPDDNGVTVAYDGFSKTITEVAADGTGGQKTLTSDAFGRLVHLSEFVGGALWANTYYAYDENDNLRQVTDPDGNITSFEHDWVGNRTHVTRGGRTWRYDYDLNGNLLAKVKPFELPLTETDVTTSYTYDDLDRVLFEYPATMGYSVPDQNRLGIGRIEYQYDAAANTNIGKLQRVKHFHGDKATPALIVRYSYNERGEPTSEWRTMVQDEIFVTSDEHTKTQNFNALGQPLGQFWTDDHWWQYGYDNRGLLASLRWYPDTNNQPFIWAVTYQRGVAGQIRSVGSAYDQSREYGYDILGRVTNDVVTGGLGTVQSQRSYAFTDSGDLKTITGNTATSMDVGATYTYDRLHRLQTAVRSDSSLSWLAYSNSGNVNLASMAGGGEANSRDVEYFYSGEDPQAVTLLMDRLTKASYLELEYDKAGNTTRRFGSSVTDMTFRWDGKDRMIEADDGIKQEVYHYDYTGQRYLAVSAEEGVRYWFAEREFHYEPGGATKDYMHLSHGGSTGARVEDNKAIELSHHDALNNLMLSLDERGLVTAAFHYSAFGEVLESIGDEDHRRQFNDKEKDRHTGLRYYGARYYDPMTLRWTGGDPLLRFAPEADFANSQQQNLYQFSLNNPLRYSDPDGRFAITLGTIACAATGLCAALATGALVVGAAVAGYIAAETTNALRAPRGPTLTIDTTPDVSPSTNVAPREDPLLQGPPDGPTQEPASGPAEGTRVGPSGLAEPHEASRKRYIPNKPGRKKQGREGWDKKRGHPNWKERNPQKEPKKHTPSRKNAETTDTTDTTDTPPEKEPATNGEVDIGAAGIDEVAE